MDGNQLIVNYVAKFRADTRGMVAGIDQIEARSGGMARTFQNRFAEIETTSQKTAGGMARTFQNRFAEIEQSVQQVYGTICGRLGGIVDGLGSSITSQLASVGAVGSDLMGMLGRSLVAGLGPYALAAAGVVTGIAVGFEATVGKVLDRIQTKIDQLRLATTTFGLSEQAAQGLQRVATALDVEDDFAALARAASAFSAKLHGTGDESDRLRSRLADLGVNLVDAVGNWRNGTEVLIDIVGRLDATKKAALNTANLSDQLGTGFAGSVLEGAGAALDQFSARLYGTGETSDRLRSALESVGIAVRDTDGDWRDASAVMAEAAAALDSATGVANTESLAVEILGDNLSALRPLLDDAAGASRAFAATDVVVPGQIETTHEIATEIAAVETQTQLLTTAWDQLTIGLGNALLPVYRDLLTAVNDGIALFRLATDMVFGFGQILDLAVGGVLAEIPTLVDAIIARIPGLRQIFELVGGIWDGVTRVAGTIGAVPSAIHSFVETEIRPYQQPAPLPTNEKSFAPFVRAVEKGTEKGAARGVAAGREETAQPAAGGHDLPIGGSRTNDYDDARHERGGMPGTSTSSPYYYPPSAGAGQRQQTGPAQSTAYSGDFPIDRARDAAHQTITDLVGERQHVALPSDTPPKPRDDRGLTHALEAVGITLDLTRDEKTRPDRVTVDIAPMRKKAELQQKLNDVNDLLRPDGEIIRGWREAESAHAKFDNGVQKDIRDQAGNLVTPWVPEARDTEAGRKYLETVATQTAVNTELYAATASEHQLISSLGLMYMRGDYDEILNENTKNLFQLNENLQKAYTAVSDLAQQEKKKTAHDKSRAWRTAVPGTSPSDIAGGVAGAMGLSSISGIIAGGANGGWVGAAVAAAMAAISATVSLAPVVAGMIGSHLSHHDRDLRDQGEHQLLALVPDLPKPITMVSDIIDGYFHGRRANDANPRYNPVYRDKPAQTTVFNITQNITGSTGDPHRLQREAARQFRADIGGAIVRQ